MDNDKYTRITLAGFVAGMVHERFRERVHNSGEDLTDLLSWKFTEAVHLDDIYSNDKGLTEMEWEYLCSVVAIYIQSYATMLSGEHTCKVTGHKSSNTLMFDFVFEKPQPKKLTVDEIEKLLGYKVEIIA